MKKKSVRHADERRGMSMIVTAACMWGTVGIVGQYLYNNPGMSPLTVGFYRLAVAACVLLAARAVVMPKERSALSGGALLGVVAVGVGLGGYQACYFAAVQAVGVGVATLATLGLAPVLVTAGSYVFFGDKVGARVLVALVAALCGLALLVWDPSGKGLRPEIFAGLALAAGSAAGYAGVTLVSRSISGRVDSFRITLHGFAIGAVVLLPLASHAGLDFEPTPNALIPLLYLGLVPSAVAYGLFFSGLRTVRPATASILTLVEPLTATILAGLVFGERLGYAGVLGGALLLSAVVALYAGRRDT